MVNMVEDDRIQIKKLELGPYGTNAYVLTCLSSNASVIVDAPADAKKIVKELAGTDPKYILMTHNHMDHTGALEELKSILNVPVAAHADDGAKLPLRPDLLLKDGDVISLGDTQLTVLHTPGHTPGSVSFLIESYLIAGDTLFPDGPGKTWSPSDFEQIVASLTRKIFVLPDETQIFPGHGDATVLKREKRLFEEFSARPHALDLCGDVLWSSS